MTKIENKNEYRIAPNIKNGLLIALLYVVYFSIALKISGVAYDQITDSANNVLKAVVLPMVGGTIMLTAVAKWSGWWKDLWHDKYKIKGHSWMWLFPIIMAIGIISTLASAKFGNTTVQMIGYIFIGTALVGYNEELLFRGMVLRSARGSGFSELRVMLVVALSFGIFHGANFFLGQDLMPTLQQIAFASINGAIFYMIFRKSGLLVVTMILHGLWDFSVFAREATLGSSPKLAAVFALIGAAVLYIPIVLLLVSLRFVNVKNDNKLTTS